MSSLHVGEVAANQAQVFEDQGFEIFGHGSARSYGQSVYQLGFDTTESPRSALPCIGAAAPAVDAYSTATSRCWLRVR